MKEKNPFKIVIASILIVSFFNYAIIGISALLGGGMLFHGATYALMKNGTNFTEKSINEKDLLDDYSNFATYRAKGIQEYLGALFGKEKDASVPTAGLYTIWTTGMLAKQLGELFILSIIEGIVIGFIVAFLFTKRPKGFELLKGYLMIVFLSIILICCSGVFINSVSTPLKRVSFLKLLPDLDLVVISIIMISVCFLFLLFARNMVDNMNKKLARKKIFNDDDKDIF